MTPEEIYAEEKFGVAVDSLATSAAPIRARIQSAHLSFMTLRVTHFSDPALAQEYADLMAELTRVEQSVSEGSVHASLAAMTEAQCESVAERIVKIYDTLREKRAIYDYAPEAEEAANGQG